MLKSIATAIKKRIPIYRYYHRLSRELLIWKKGLYQPGHYYSPIVDPQKLPQTVPIDYNLPIPAVDLNESAQVDLLKNLATYYKKDILPIRRKDGHRFYLDNEYFSYSDGIFLALMMQHFKPKMVIEVGSGYSSALMLDINEKVLHNVTELLFIEPYPEARLDRLTKDQDKVVVRQDFVQRIELSLFRKLNQGDILFIDSSHTSKFGSDINYLLFEVLPVLDHGVIIHFHDIFFPFEYPLEWLKQGRSWNEAYLIRAFLQHNSDYEILLFTSFLEGKYRSWFETNMPLCLEKHEFVKLNGVQHLLDITGQSLYIRKK
jgi:predicted O-methyltransferase YrrM